MQFSGKHSLGRLLCLAALAGAGFAGHGEAEAHTVGLGWDVQGNGDVKFYLAHWHGDLGGPSEFLTIDGINYNFTGIQNNVAVRTGLEGTLCATTFYSCPGDGTMTSLGTSVGFGPSNDWLTVTVSGLSSGNHTFTASTAALTNWTIPSNNGTFTFTLPNVVPEPASLALVGASLVGLALTRRKRKAATPAG